MESHDDPFFHIETAVGNDIMFPIEEFQRTMAQYRIFLVDPDHFPMEIDELLILSSPGVSSPVVRIGEATESCLVSIIKGRRAGPGHLHGHSLPHNGDIDLLLRRPIAELGHSSHPMVGPGQETGVVMVGQFVHGHLQRRSHKAYNKSVREFDVVTMDRIRKIEVEADFQVWKEYAYANGLHPAVISYLNTKKQNFYQMETTVDGRCFATPRGWEDLSTMIGIYEKIDKTIDREVVAQYIQHPKIAKDFANYLELFYKYRTDYQIEEIFKGNPDEILMKKVSHASFDERLAVLGLLISKVNERIRFAVEKEEEMELLQGTLIRYKESGQAEVSKDALELLEEVTAGLLFEEKQKKEAELLSRRQEQNYRRAGTLLETYLQRLRLEGSMDFETAFAKIKEWFEEENQKYLQMGQTAEQYLEYAFDFLEGTGLTGQEMVIFITELNSNARSVAFLQECESERYFRYNKELLFSEKREKILEKLN